MDHPIQQIRKAFLRGELPPERTHQIREAIDNETFNFQMLQSPDIMNTIGRPPHISENLPIEANMEEKDLRPAGEDITARTEQHPHKNDVSVDAETADEELSPEGESITI